MASGLTRSNVVREVASVADHAGVEAVPEDWTGVDAVLPLLLKMKAEGAVVVLKIDGQRVGAKDEGAYTAVISGGRLGDGFARSDARSLEEAVARVVVEYAERGWEYRRRAHA